MAFNVTSFLLIFLQNTLALAATKNSKIDGSDKSSSTKPCHRIGLIKTKLELGSSMFGKTRATSSVATNNFENVRRIVNEKCTEFVNVALESKIKMSKNFKI